MTLNIRALCTKCHYAECHISLILLLSVVMLNVIVMSVVAPKYDTQLSCHITYN
jgi:hypothetical protein